ncbi:MAG TPA: hypothetical protein VJ225_07545 [Nitrososphaeraceae archaeon]|nr:hypothetical protein [Nitrososphaeraceae archaeon]
MEEIEEKSIIELASSYTDPVDFGKVIDGKFDSVPSNEKGSLFG